MQKICQSHGGTWSQAQETCGMSAAEASRAARQAKDICAEQGEKRLIVRVKVDRLGGIGPKMRPWT
jgi:hypothetical protein